VGHATGGSAFYCTLGVAYNPGSSRQKSPVGLSGAMMIIIQKVPDGGGGGGNGSGVVVVG
jgi:hypothetical protein